MQQHRFLGLLELIAVAISLMVDCGCGAKAPPSAPPPPSVRVTAVVQQDVPLFGEWVATLDGYINAQIQPQVSGYLVKQSYTEGSFVKKGDVLFEIDPRPFQAALDQTRAQLAQAEAQLGKANLDVERDTPLVQARAIAQSQLDNEIQAQLAASASVDAAKAMVAQAQLNLEFTQVRSLVGGVAGFAQGQIGNLVTPSTLLTSVSQIDPIKAYIALSEQEYLHVAERINAIASGRESLSAAPIPELILADGSTYPFKGRFIFTDRQVDPSTGSIRCAAAFPNPTSILRPGQFGRLRVAPDTVKAALLVPQRAVTELQGNYQVAVVDSDNSVDVRSVKVGQRSGTMWIVQSGLKPGENVIVEGMQIVRQGMHVTTEPFMVEKGN
jgi:RND family efflux transporter MFP subunit